MDDDKVEELRARVEQLERYLLESALCAERKSDSECLRVGCAGVKHGGEAWRRASEILKQHPEWDKDRK